MDKEYEFFRENLRRTVLSQSRYLCPRRRVQPSQHLYSSRSQPLLPSLNKRGQLSNNKLKSLSPEFKSATSLTTEISTETGRRKTRLKVTIPTARPWSVYSTETSIKSSPSAAENRSWSYKSPVFVTDTSTMTSPTHQVTSSHRSAPSLTDGPSSCSTDYMSLTDYYPAMNQDPIEVEVPRTADSNRMTVISGVCLLNSIEEMERGLIKGVKSVLHRQI